MPLFLIKRFNTFQANPQQISSRSPEGPRPPLPVRIGTPNVNSGIKRQPRRAWQGHPVRIYACQRNKITLSQLYAKTLKALLGNLWSDDSDSDEEVCICIN